MRLWSLALLCWLLASAAFAEEAGLTLYVFKKGLPVSGWVNLDKPYDFGSTQAVGKVRWLFTAQKAGSTPG